VRCREIITEEDQARHTLLSASLANTASSSGSVPEPTPKPPLYSEDAHPIKFPFTPKHPAAPPSSSPPPVAQQGNTAATDDASQSQEQGTESSKSHKGQAEALSQAIQALLKSVQGDAGNDQPFGDQDDVVVMDGEDGEKIYLIVDDVEVSDELDHLKDNAGQEGGSKSDDIRKKLTHLVKRSTSITVDRISDVLKQNPKEDEDEENVPTTYDEL